MSVTGVDGDSLFCAVVVLEGVVVFGAVVCANAAGDASRAAATNVAACLMLIRLTSISWRFSYALRMTVRVHPALAGERTTNSRAPVAVQQERRKSHEFDGFIGG